MHYKYKYEINGKILDETNEEISKLVIKSLLELYDKYKDDTRIFPKGDGYD
jgi:hypothetical protein